MTESAKARHTNTDLGSFNQCVAAVIAGFPFYADGDEGRYEEVAEELRDLIFGIDEIALATTGSGRRSVTTRRSGTMRTGMRDPAAISAFGQPSKLRAVAAMQPSTR